MTRVVIFHNIASDPQGRSLANFDGYTPGHPLVPVYRYQTEELNTPDEIGNEAYRLFNVGDDPDFGTPDERAVAYRAAKNRSLSKGDVLLVGGVWLACASSGWDEIRAPTYLARNAKQHGTTPLDRSDHMRDVTLTYIATEDDEVDPERRSADQSRLGEMAGDLSAPTPSVMLVPGVNGDVVHTVTGAKHSALRVRLISAQSRNTERGVETVVVSDETFYYPTGQPFDWAEACTLEVAKTLGYRHVDRCVSGAGAALTFVV